jgi:PAS domain S-box-containing protein
VSDPPGAPEPEASEASDPPGARERASEQGSEATKATEPSRSEGRRRLPGLTRLDASGASENEEGRQPVSRPGDEAGRTAGRTEIVLRQYPVGEARAVAEYYRTLFREFTLIAAADPSARHTPSLRLLGLVRDVRARYEEIGGTLNRQVRAARARGHQHEDLVVPLERAARDHVLRLGHLLREVDRYARKGLLLTPPTPPAVAAVRDWYLHELVEQLEGAPPLPWPEWDRPGRLGDELSLAAEQARLAFDVGRLGFWQWTPATGRLRLGPALEALVGLQPGEFAETGEGYLQLVHPDDRAAVQARIEQALTSGGELRLEHRVVRRDGEVLWIEARGAGLADETGTIVGWAGVGIDTTDAKRRAIERSELLAEAVKARKEAERANAALRRVVDRLDTLVRQEHHIAQTLQRAMFTENLPDVPGMAMAARYLPGAAELTVGGDWYDVVVTANGPLLVIGDVAGHGLRAAAVMARIRHALHFAVGERTGPAELLSRLNEFIVRSAGDDLATVHVMLIDVERAELRFSSAGHLPPVLRRAQGEVRLLTAGLGPPLGAVRDVVLPEAVEAYEAGDRLVLYTDGLVERRGEPLDRSLDRLLAAVASAPEAVDDLIAAVLSALLEEEPSDDVAVLAVQL